MIVLYEEIIVHSSSNPDVTKGHKDSGGSSGAPLTIKKPPEDYSPGGF